MSEICWYANEGMAAGYGVEVEILLVDPVDAAARNLHSVPLRTVQEMSDRIHKIRPIAAG